MKEILKKINGSMKLSKVNDTTYKVTGLDKMDLFNVSKEFKDANGESYSISSISDEILVTEIVKRAVANKFMEEVGLNPMEIRILEFTLFDSLESVVLSLNIVNGVKEVLVG